jgi:nucleoside diphosphate kinase
MGVVGEVARDNTSISAKGGTRTLTREIDWNKSAFMLLAPDALARHLAIPILDRLAGEGFVPIRYRVFWRPLESLDEYYGKKIRIDWDVYLFRMVDLFFRYGPTVAFVVKDVGSSAEDSHVRLRRLKGASDPFKTAPGSIRHDFAAINLMLSLIHSADNPDDSAYESGVYFRDEEPRVLDDGWAELRDVCRLLASGAPQETRSFEDTLGGLRARIAALLWKEFRPEGREMIARWTAADGKKPFNELGAGTRLAEQLKDGMQHPLAAMLASEFQPDSPLVQVEVANHMLRAYGTSLDPWEELVLTTSMYFRPLRKGLSPEHVPLERFDPREVLKNEATTA